MLQLYDKCTGFIPLLGGIYGLLLAYRVVPRQPKDPEKLELWHRRFGPMMKVLGPVLIVFGLLQLLDAFR